MLGRGFLKKTQATVRGFQHIESGYGVIFSGVSQKELSTVAFGGEEGSISFVVHIKLKGLKRGRVPK